MDTIIQCCRRNWYKKLEKLFKPSMINYVDANDNTLHIICAQHKSLQCLTYLLKYDYSRIIEKRNRFGFKAIDYAVLNHDYEMFLVLRRAYGVRVNKKTEETLKKTKNISMLYLLNNQSKRAKKIFNKASIKGRVTEDNKKYVELMMKCYKKFSSRNIEYLGIGSLVVSHFILNSTANYIDDGINIVSEDLKKKLRLIRRMRLSTLENTYSRKLKTYMKYPRIDNFQKSVQWPHIPLAYLEQNKGSCVDLAILKYLVLKEKGEKITLGLWKGSNTYISHVEVRQSTDVDIQNLDLMFCLFTMYHVFRHLQYIRYMVKNKRLENKLIQFVVMVLTQTIKDTKSRNKIKKFLLQRTQETYDECIGIIKTRKDRFKITNKPVTTSLKNSKNVIKNLQQYFKTVVINPRSKVITYKNVGYGVYREETAEFLQRYQKVKVPKNFMYISYILRKNPEFTGVTEMVVKELKKRTKLPILLEIKKSNKIPFKIYLRLGFKVIGEKDHQYLMILKR